MSITLTLRATHEEASTIRAAAVLAGLTVDRFIEHASVDMGGIVTLADRHTVAQNLAELLTVEMGNGEHAIAVETAQRHFIPMTRYPVVAALRYVCHQQRNHLAGSAWQAIQVPAC